MKKEQTTKEKEYKVIIKPSIARKLLHKGNQIIDIKPNKNKPNETVFVFKDNEKFRENLREVTKKRVRFVENK